jgi:putative transposase
MRHLGDYVTENDKVELNGLEYKVIVASPLCIVLQSTNGDLVTLQTDQYTELASLGQLIVKKPKPGIIIEALSDDELVQADMYRKFFDLMGQSNKPYSKENFDTYVKPLIIAKYNFNPAIVPSFSTVAAKRREWVANGQLMAPIVTRKPHFNKSSKFDTGSLDLVSKCSEIHYLKLGGISKAQTYAQYLIEIKKPENKHLTRVGKSSFYSFLERLDAYQVAVARKGLMWANNEFRTTYRNYMASYGGEKIEVDAVHLTMNILDDDRNKVIATKVILYLAIDIYTRLIVGYYCSLEDKKRPQVAEHADAVVELLKRVVSRADGSHREMKYLGKPTMVVCDAGTAFNNEQVKNFFNQICVQLIVTETAKPWRKPYIERFNRTLREQLGSVLPQYTSNKTSHLRQKELKAAGAAMSKKEFIFELEDFLFEYYQNNPHMGLGGRTPNEAYNEGQSSNLAKLPLDKKVFENLWANSDKRAYCKNKGIAFECGRYNSPALTDFMRSVGEQRVTIRFTKSDASKIGVVHPKLRTVITVENVDARVTEGTTIAEAKAIYKTKQEGFTAIRPIKRVYAEKMAKIEAEKEARIEAKERLDRSAHGLQEEKKVDHDIINNPLHKGAKHYEEYSKEDNTNNTGLPQSDGYPVGKIIS